jgi:glycosyltransferase involved in cell wall biosynthesis
MPMTQSVSPGLASIIIPCWNQQEFTRHCLRALFRHTPPPWELIVIDNGSTDGTAAYLQGVQDTAPVPVTIIANQANRGFPAAVNQGLKAARGEFLVLLNNDAVVTDAWLQHLIALTRMKPQGKPVGLAGPMSNYVSPPQLVEHPPYRDLQALEAFARSWREKHRGQCVSVPKLSGFCLLLTRAVYDAIGGLDERFGLGMFDDDDLAVRARQAGFELALARDVFVHHFGSRSFAGNGIDAEALLAENQQKFAAKWGDAAPQGRRIGLSPWQGHLLPAAPASPPIEEEPPVDPSQRAKVSLTMIVRNEEKNLPHCLKSAKGLFDEIVIVDTGSTDRTKEIAAKFKAKIVDFPWIDDFAAARNVSLAHATGDYAFWLDADDVIDPPERKKLKAIIDRLRTDRPAAYVVRCACDKSDEKIGQTVVDHVRLFPLRENIRWTYRIHEQIVLAVRKAGFPIRWTDLTVRHTGYTDPAVVDRKHERDMKILLAELADKPDDPFVLFNLGSYALERGSWQEGLDYSIRSLSRSAPGDSITRKLFVMIAKAHQMLGDTSKGLKVCGEGLSFFPDDAELWFRKAILHLDGQEYAQAENAFRRILDLKRPEQFCSLDHGIYGHLTRRNLAKLAAARRDDAEARRQWEAVLAECPGDAEAGQQLAELAVAA